MARPAVGQVEPAHEDVASLEEILAYADQHAPTLQVTRERLGLGDAAMAGATLRVPENPNVTIGVGPGFNSGGNHVDVFASISQRLEVAGERGLRVDAAKQTRARLEAEVDEARWEVHREVHAAFHRALVARERLAVATRLVDFQQRLLDIARRRLQAGDVSSLDVRLAEGEVSRTRVAHIVAQQRYVQATIELGAASGWPASRPPKPAGQLEPPHDPPDFETLVDVARRHQPRLRTLQAAHEEAHARQRAEERQAWPQPTLGIQVMRESFRLGPPETQVLGMLSVPIPVARRNHEARALAKAEMRIAQARRGAFATRLLHQIQRHRSAVEAAAARVQVYGREILPTFEENLRLIQRAFELGEIDILQVSVAREQFLRMQTDALDAYDDYFQAVAELEASIGTDLWPDPSLEPTPDGKMP